MIKNATVFRITDNATKKLLSNLGLFITEPTIGDPDKTQWARAGFAQHPCLTLPGDSPVFTAADGTRVVIVELRERILPGKVIKKKLAERIDDITERQGKKPNRKEIAGMKDEIVAELLPTSHIKPTEVHIVVKGEYLIICTTSARLVDLCLVLLKGAYPNNELHIEHIAKGREPAKWMLDLLLAYSPGGGEFNSGKSVALRNEDKATARFKDMSLDADAVTDRVTAGFRPTEIAVEYGDDITFTLTDKLLIKRLKFSDILLNEVDNEVGEDKSSVTHYDATVVLVAGQMKKLLNALLAEIPQISEEDEL